MNFLPLNAVECRCTRLMRTSLPGGRYCREAAVSGKGREEGEAEAERRAEARDECLA